jgi:hypothetical protein
MSIDAEVLNSKPVDLLHDMYRAEYTSRSLPPTRDPVPSMLNALGACAGFAAQAAVWRELVLPAKRNPGDFLVYTTTKSHEIFFFGEAINQFLFATTPGHLSFLSLAAGSLSNASELPDIHELVAHVVQSLGTERFGQPRLPPSVDLPELPRVALTRTWGKAARILEGHRPGEWPVLLGATAHHVVNSNRKSLAPSIAVRILLEAAAPMSKLDPTTLEQSGIPAPSLTDWSMRAFRPENNQAIVADVRAAMPAMPVRIAARPPMISQPKIAFLNLAGARCASIAADDRAVIGACFGEDIEVTTGPVPACDVLFLYCDFEPSGSIVGQPRSVREVIGDSAAVIVVIASQVPAEVMDSREFQFALADSKSPPINLVITNNRNAEHFGRFFQALFEMMATGVSMPMAWVQLAPQGPMQRDDIPGTVCLMGAGHVSFAVPSGHARP